MIIFLTYWLTVLVFVFMVMACFCYGVINKSKLHCGIAKYGLIFSGIPLVGICIYKIAIS